MKNKIASLSFVLSIIPLVLVLFSILFDNKYLGAIAFVLCIILGFVSVVLGIISLIMSKKYNLGGKNMSIASIILGSIEAISIILLILWIWTHL